MPPWPSVAAGAIRSRMLEDGAIELSRFANGEKPAGRLGDSLGTPDSPGSFRLAWFSMARRNGDAVEPVVPLPADLVAQPENENLLYLNPRALPARFHASYLTPQPAVLCREKDSK